MKVLVVNDNPAINTIIEEILNDDGHEIYGATKLDDAEIVMEAFRPEVVIIEEVVDGEDAMSFIDKIDPESGVKILMLTNGKKMIPKDKPMILGVIRKPFKAADILDPIRLIRDGATSLPAKSGQSEDKKGKKHFFGFRKQETKKEEPKDDEDNIIRFGQSYAVYEDIPKSVYTVTKEFIPQGVDIIVLSFDRKKTIQTYLSDENAEVITVTPKGRYGTEDATMLGTLMAKIMAFIDKSVRPVVVIDNFTKMIEINEINRALMLVCQIFTGTEKKFSMVLSVRENQFTDKDKVLLSKYMERYNFELEKAEEERRLAEKLNEKMNEDLNADSKNDLNIEPKNELYSEPPEVPEETLKEEIE